jgi:GTPase SAR1 family protein
MSDISDSQAREELLRTEKIQTILKNRRPFAEKANKIVTRLSVASTLAEFAEFLPEVLQREIPDESRNKIISIQNRIPSLQQEISSQKAGLQQLELRFNRSTLNIGIVGNARQGKSTFLQALTGLTNEEIPAAETDHCTGAPSLIINHKETFADIEFFTENGFLQEVIAPFYMQLSLTPQPASFESFASAPLATPDRKLSATEDALYDKLKFRHAQAKAYQPLLGKASERISKEQIRSYIAQQDKTGKKISTWLAVKIATIYCPFRVAEAEGISVCDTPGLGDFVCGAEDSLVHSIGRNLDTVLMLKRTPKGGIATPEDTMLYDLLPKAISEFNPKDWSHFIINRDGTENETKSFEEQIQEKIQCRTFMTLDAREQDEVLSSFDKILEDVASNQQALDATLSDSRFKNIRSLVERLVELAAEAKSALPKSIGTDGMGMAQLQSLFDPIWKDVAENLNNLTLSYRSGRDNSEKLTKQVDEIKSDVLLQIRKRLENIEKRDYAGQKIAQFTSDLFHELRLKIATAFDKLDDNFIESIDTLRSEVCEVFKESGKLAGIFDEADSQTWLRDVAGAWKTLDNGEGIADVIERFADTGFTFRGYLLAKVRGSLNPLDEEEQESIKYRYAIGNDWEDVRHKLWSACNRSVEGCADVLKGLSVDKNGALFSCNEQFTDGVLRFGGWNNAKQLWANFYDEYKSEIWVDHFAKIDVNKTMRRDWDMKVASLEKAMNEFAY